MRVVGLLMLAVAGVAGVSGCTEGRTDASATASMPEQLADVDFRYEDGGLRSVTLCGDLVIIPAGTDSGAIYDGRTGQRNELEARAMRDAGVAEADDYEIDSISSPMCVRDGRRQIAVIQFKSREDYDVTFMTAYDSSGAYLWARPGKVAGLGPEGETVVDERTERLLDPRTGHALSPPDKGESTMLGVGRRRRLGVSTYKHYTDVYRLLDASGKVVPHSSAIRDPALLAGDATLVLGHEFDEIGRPEKTTAFDPLTGKHLWTSPVAHDFAYAEVSAVLDRSAGVVLMHDDDHRLNGVSAYTGEVLWKMPITKLGSIGAANGVGIYTRSSGIEGAWLFDTRTGERLRLEQRVSVAGVSDAGVLVIRDGTAHLEAPEDLIAASRARE